MVGSRSWASTRARRRAIRSAERGLGRAAHAGPARYSPGSMPDGGCGSPDSALTYAARVAQRDAPETRRSPPAGRCDAALGSGTRVTSRPCGPGHGPAAQAARADAARSDDGYRWMPSRSGVLPLVSCRSRSPQRTSRPGSRTPPSWQWTTRSSAWPCPAASPRTGWRAATGRSSARRWPGSSATR